ncbi:PREDICTED: autoimmune regulator [Corvus brachyrhynchos]|uniref:autoimmune regulator n=1 Tax=Corvus brachyrhynchos TaxID=85066 RepID=UPI00081645C8|nr:PREDICTED: autoimmune regulator [Corvus brachyrhynchos]
MAGPGSDGDLRRLLKLHRTEIAMAVDDVFPLLHGLADHDVVPEHIFKVSLRSRTGRSCCGGWGRRAARGPWCARQETLSRTEREGSHRAFHALLTWLLGRDAAAVRDFWAVLFKDYNLERYSRLRPLRGAFPREVELGRQRRGRRLSPSPTAPAPHRPQGKRKAPEERDKARAAQPAARHSASPGPLVKAKAVKRSEGTDTPRTSRASGECQNPQGSFCLPPGCGCLARGQEQKPQPEGPCPAQGIPKCTDNPLLCFHPHLVQLPRLWRGVVPAWHRGHGLGVSPSASHASPNPFLSCQQNREPQLHPQGQLPAATVYSQDPVPHQENEDECAACGDGGELICCDGCPRAFHLACLVPPLPHVPSGTWRCGSCVESVAEPGRLLEADLAVERPPEILGEAARDTQPGGAKGSVCSHCCSRIPTPRHCPAPSGDPRGLLLCTSCTGTLDTGSLGTTAAAGDQLLPAAKAEDGALGSEPVLSRDELDALLGESTWDGILQWAFQSMAQPLADTHGLLA